MTGTRLAQVGLAAVLLASAGAATAQPITVAGLQRLLQEAPPRELQFRETRESPWLAAPIESSGSMRSSATMLEKQVERPRRETWTLFADRMQLVAPGASAPRQILFSEAPALAPLANALRSALAGDLAALEQDFRLVPAGDARLWTLQLTPRRGATARFLKQLELQGSGAHLKVIVILESSGERTITRLNSEP